MLSNVSMVDGTVNKMPLIFSFKNPVKDLVITMTLKSTDKTDVRRY